MPTLPFLRKFARPSAPGVYTTLEQNAFAATSTRLYFAFRQPSTVNYQVVVTDYMGMRQNDEEFTFTVESVAWKVIGMDVVGDFLYVGVANGAVTLDFYGFRVQLSTVTKGADSKTTYTMGLPISLPDMDMIVVGTVAYVFRDVGTTSGYYRFDISGNTWTIRTWINPFNPGVRVALRSGFSAWRWIQSITHTATRTYMDFLQGSTYGLQARGAPTQFTTRHSDDDVVIGTSGLSSTNRSRGMGYYGNGIVVIDETMVYLFGTEPPVPPMPAEIVARQQYQGLYEFEEFFDLVKVSGSTISTHRVTGVPGLRQVTTRNYSVASAVATQLATILFIPRTTIPSAEVGDILFRHAGALNVQPTTLPSQRWRVDGIETAGPDLTQTFFCSLVT